MKKFISIFVVALIFWAFDMNASGTTDCSQEIIYQSNFVNASKGLPTSKEWWGVDFGDADKDGYLDLIATCAPPSVPGGGFTYLWFGNGGSNWKNSSQNPLSSFNGGVKFCDWNKDGNLDFIVGDWPEQTNTGKGIEIWKGYGTGHFTKVCVVKTGKKDKWGAVDIADVNNDGNLDIGSGGYDGTRVWAGDGTGNWVSISSGLPQKFFDCGVFFADINKDGKMDLLKTGGSNEIYIGNGQGSWTLNQGFFGRACGAAFGDVNKDGNLDVVYGSYVASTGVRVMLGDGTGNWVSSSTGLPKSGDYLDIKIADITKDGNLDIVTSGYEKGKLGIQIYSGDGTGKWTELSTNLPKDACVGIAVGDVNNDGSLDIGATFVKLGVQVWLNNPIVEYDKIVILIIGLPLTFFIICYANRNKYRKIKGV